MNTAGPAKQPRADAQRNRTKIMAAAEEVFAERGTSASTEEIARRAGVAVGTIFRHFPTKPDLIRAVFADRIRTIGEQARELETADDPGEALCEFIRIWSGQTRAKYAMAEVLASAGINVGDVSGEYAGQLEALLATIQVLLTRAQESGQIRTDVGVDELHALMVGTARAAESPGSDAVQQRVIQVILDGLLRESPAR